MGIHEDPAEATRQPPPRRRLPNPLLAVWVVALAVGVSELLARTVLLAAEPVRAVLYGLVLAAVTYAAFSWGVRGGVTAALAAVPYAFFFYGTWVPTILPLPTDRLRLSFAVALLTLGFGAGLGKVRARIDRMQARAIDAEQGRARVEQATRRAIEGKNAQLEAANATLAQANRQLEEANDTLESFSYVVSHDLKEPLRALDVLTSALQEDHAAALSREGRELVRAAREATHRLAVLMTGLLEVGRAARAGEHELHPVWVAEAVEHVECRTRYQDVLRQRGARLEVTTLAGTPPVLATTSTLCQILGNLILNAIRHNPHRTAPQVRVRVQPLDAEGTRVEMVVEDDGPGFPPELAASVTTGRSDARPLREGGFGLIIVQRATTHLGGRLWVDRSTGLGGAAVHVALPAATAENLRRDRYRPPPGREASKPRGQQAHNT